MVRPSPGNAEAAARAGRTSTLAHALLWWYFQVSPGTVGVAARARRAALHGSIPANCSSHDAVIGNDAGICIPYAVLNMQIIAAVDSTDAYSLSCNLIVAASTSLQAP